MPSFKKIGNIEFNESKIQRFAQHTPLLLANNTENHFKEGFRKGGGQTNSSLNGWPERQFTKGKGSRNLLIQTGTLQRDIQKRVVTFSKIVVGTSSLTNKYADTHNEGAKIRVTEKMRKYFWAMHHKSNDKAEKEYYKNLALTKKAFINIPKREFIGMSTKLEKENELIIDREMLKIFQ